MVAQLRMKSKPPHDLKSLGPLPPLWPQLPPSLPDTVVASEMLSTIPSGSVVFPLPVHVVKGASLHILPSCFLTSFKPLFKSHLIRGLPWCPLQNSTRFWSRPSIPSLSFSEHSSLVIKYLLTSYPYKKISSMKAKPYVLFIDSCT